MTTQNALRCLALASAALGALMLAAGAGSRPLTYTSAEIEVSGPLKLGATGSQVIHVIVAATDDPTAKVVIFAPAGYTASLTAASGAQIGTVTAKVQAADLGGATLPLSGVVNAADANTPIPFGGGTATLGAVATQCTGTATHAAFWLLVLTAAGQTLRLPAFVDPAAGTETAFASFKIQLCLPPPDAPAGTPGRATFGAKLFDARLTLKNAFTNPTASQLHVWSAFFTPYNPGLGTANAPAAVEARSVALMPLGITLKGKYDRKRRAAALSGTLTYGGQDPSTVTIQLGSGAAATKLKAAGFASKATKSGAFTATRRITRTTYFQAGVASSAIDLTSQICGAAASQAPAGCVSGNVGPVFFSSSIVKVAVAKK